MRPFSPSDNLFILRWSARITRTSFHLPVPYDDPMPLLALLAFAFSGNMDLPTSAALLEIIANGPHPQSWEVYLRWPTHALAVIESSQRINPRCSLTAVKGFIFSVASDAETDGCTPVNQDWIVSRSSLAVNGIFLNSQWLFRRWRYESTPGWQMWRLCLVV